MTKDEKVYKFLVCGRDKDYFYRGKILFEDEERIQVNDIKIGKIDLFKRFIISQEATQ